MFLLLLMLSAVLVLYLHSTAGIIEFLLSVFIQQTICLMCCVQHNSHISTSVRFDVWSHGISLLELFCEPWCSGDLILD